LAAGALAAGGIDRRPLVRRHNPSLTGIDPRSPLSVGNGELAFTADITGLQSFPEAYERGIPLCTQSQWGWHSFPIPNGLAPDDLKLEMYDTYGRPVGYPTRAEGQREIFNWLRENPHRLHLGRIGFAIERGAVSETHQTLDLWTGVLTSRFRLKGAPVSVRTCCHPKLDLIAAAVVCQEPIAIAFEFPYGSPLMNAADWNRPEAHQTSVSQRGPERLDLLRELDRDRYSVAIAWRGAAQIEQTGAHRFHLRGKGRIGFVCSFSPQPAQGSLPSAGESLDASQRHWAGFWSGGAAVDLAVSKDPRAKELERRIVLSQYLTAIQCSGSAPPQETGLTCNSWYGKFHLEMHWWHAAHFALWGRVGMLERSLPWYQSVLPSARRKARDQGYTGARWPKMTCLAGRDSPSPVGPLLIWEQPHPISYAEFCYRAHPNRETLERYREIVFETAEFMTSYAHWDGKRYTLGPPLIPAQENHPPRETWNPTFELEYWAHALKLAGTWRERLGLAADPKWEHVRRHLSALPVASGVYLAHENCPQTFTERNRDHPSMLAALGVLPGERVDREIMRRTLKKVMKEWRWTDTWGWDYPMVAMTAARLGEPQVAIDALLMDSPKNEYLPNGHNYQRPNLPLYLPGNGGLLAAVALMATARAFPQDSWQVHAEGLHALL